MDADAAIATPRVGPDRRGPGTGSADRWRTGVSGVEPVSEDPLPPGPTIEAARALLAEGRPFSAHEVFEARWKDAPTAERDLWQGLAQLCVGSTHRERGNARGARTLWQRALRRLTTYATTDQPTYGLDLDAITGWLTQQLGELADESAASGPGPAAALRLDAEAITPARTAWTRGTLSAGRDARPRPGR